MKRLTKIITLCMILFVSCAFILPVQTETFKAYAASTVKISKTKATVIKGKTLQLKMKGTKKKVTWSSNKKSVATVTKKGKITAKKAGTAMITAKVGKKKYKCRITVKNPTTTLSKTKLTLTPNQKYTLRAKSNGKSSKIIWKTSNASIASVSSKGVVQGKRTGTTKITATMNGVSKSCTVTVRMIVGTPSNPIDPKKGHTVKDSFGTMSYKLLDTYVNAEALTHLKSIGEDPTDYSIAVEQFDTNLVVFKFTLTAASGYTEYPLHGYEIIGEMYRLNCTSKIKDWLYFDLYNNANLDAINVELYNGQSNTVYCVYGIPKDVPAFTTYFVDEYNNKHWVKYVY